VNGLKRFLACILAAALLAALGSGCGAESAGTSSSAADGRLRVVATDFPAYDFARAVCGSLAEVSMLLPPGAESHTYEPTPADILAVRGCDLFFYVGGEGDAWVDTLLEAAEPQGAQLRMMDCVPLLEEETTPGMTSREERSQGETAEYDEHVWTAPANASAITAAVGEKLAELDAANAAAYRANARAYEEKINALDGAFREFFAGVRNKTLVFGDRFPLRYFAQAYGLTCYAAFPGCSAQTEPSAATVAFLTDKVKEEHLTTVYYIEFSNHLVADSIAEADGVATALFHTCHNVSQKELDGGATYVSLMEQNLRTLRATMT
jgi:zinc transport system substrate-binding protein